MRRTAEQAAPADGLTAVAEFEAEDGALTDIDALVVVTALRQHALAVTSDPDDLQHLASSLHGKLAIYTV